LSGLKDEKMIKKQTYIEAETCKLYSRVFWIFLPNIIKIDPYNFELYLFKVGSFFETQCSLSLDTKFTTKYLCAQLSAFYTFCIAYTAITSHRCWVQSCVWLPTDIVKWWQIADCESLSCSPCKDHHCIIVAAVPRPVAFWRRPPGRPSHTWLRAVEDQLKPWSFCLTAAWRKATNWDAWHTTVRSRVAVCKCHSTNKNITQVWYGLGHLIHLWSAMILIFGTWLKYGKSQQKCLSILEDGYR